MKDGSMVEMMVFATEVLLVAKSVLWKAEMKVDMLEMMMVETMVAILVGLTAASTVSTMAEVLVSE